MNAADQYRAIREGAAIGAVDHRALVALTGADRRSYLQGLLTNDIKALAPGTGCYAAWLMPNGRMLTDMHVLESGTMIRLDLPVAQYEAILQRLDEYIFSEDVRVQSMKDALTAVWIHGPQAAAILARVVGAPDDLPAWDQYRHAPLVFAAAPVVVARIDQLGVPGYCVHVEPAHAGALRSAMESAGAVPAGRGAIEAARIEAGYPVFGVDMSDDTIPLEAGIEARAISFTKGCYVGQEIIARVLHRGGGRVARKLVALRVQGGCPDPGARLLAGEREVGRVTSAAESPSHGVIALAYVHRDFTAPGTAVRIEGPSGTAAATVSDRPMQSAA